MQIIAHRGAHQDNSEENTPLAFSRAISLGFSMLELDACLTKDDHLVIHHDPEAVHGVRRITIRDHLLNDLVADGICTNDPVRFGQSKKCPTLEMVLDVFLPQIRINVELKEKRSGQVFSDLLKKMSSCCKPFQSGEILKKLVLSSFEERELIVVKKHFPEIETALLISRFQFPLYSADRKKLGRLKKFGVQAIHLPLRKVTKEMVDYLKYHHDFAVRVYTVNDLKSMFHCLYLNVDSVFTDKAESLSWVGIANKPASQSVST